jgi:hypothetical protein
MLPLRIGDRKPVLEHITVGDVPVRTINALKWLRFSFGEEEYCKEWRVHAVTRVAQGFLLVYGIHSIHLT